MTTNGSYQKNGDLGTNGGGSSPPPPPTGFWRGWKKYAVFVVLVAVVATVYIMSKGPDPAATKAAVVKEMTASDLSFDKNGKLKLFDSFSKLPSFSSAGWVAAVPTQLPMNMTSYRDLRLAWQRIIVFIWRSGHSLQVVSRIFPFSTSSTQIALFWRIMMSNRPSLPFCQPWLDTLESLFGLSTSTVDRPWQPLERPPRTTPSLNSTRPTRPTS